MSILYLHFFFLHSNFYLCNPLTLGGVTSGFYSDIVRGKSHLPSLELAEDYIKTPWNCFDEITVNA